MPIIPLADATRKSVRFPLVTVTLVALNIVAFVWEIGSSDAAILRFCVVPKDLMQGHGGVTPLTAMFLHAGFMHIIGNMLFLSAFAPAVEDAMGAAGSSSSTCLEALLRRRRRSPWLRHRPSRSSAPAERLPR